MDQADIRLAIMTPEMYHVYFREYQHAPDLYLQGQPYIPYVYSPETADRYIRRQTDLGRISLAILQGEEIVGEIILKNIEPKQSATMGITLKNAAYQGRGIGTRAEKLAVRYAFDELDVPTLFADTIRTNTRSQHVLEKIGFRLIRETEDFKYYRIDREQIR